MTAGQEMVDNLVIPISGLGAGFIDGGRLPLPAPWGASKRPIRLSAPAVLYTLSA